MCGWHFAILIPTPRYLYIRLIISSKYIFFQEKCAKYLCSYINFSNKWCYIKLIISIHIHVKFISYNCGNFDSFLILIQLYIIYVEIIFELWTHQRKAKRSHFVKTKIVPIVIIWKGNYVLQKFRLKMFITCMLLQILLKRIEKEVIYVILLEEPT